jgi:hypothetical protein
VLGGLRWTPASRRYRWIVFELRRADSLFRPPKCCARVGEYSNSPQTHLDRLLHRYALLILDGDYYRLRDHRDEPEAVRHPWCRGQPGPDAQRDC